MTIDIEKLEQAALVDTEDEIAWSSTTILNLVHMLEAAEKEVSRLEWIISLHPAIDPSVLLSKETKE